MNNSVRLMRGKQGRIKRGASIMPRKTVVPAPSAVAPPRLSVLRRTKASPPTTSGRMRQYQSSADRAEITITSGSTPKAKLVIAAGSATRKGAGPPPTYPKTKAVPARVASASAVTTALRLSSARRAGASLSSRSAMAACSAKPLNTSRKLKARRFSDKPQAMKRITTMPRTGCRWVRTDSEIQPL
jgi:hypothetical protein